ncbi:MAG: hypothetical protein ACPGWR_29680 [Ardenticatenaceae bacterium]
MMEFGLNTRRTTEVVTTDAKHVYLCFLLIVGLLFNQLWGTPASAQAEATVETLTVSLLPQFNDRRLLIIYEATLNQAGSARLAIPSAVELHAATYRAEDGTLTNMEAEFEAASDGRFIRFSSPNRTARLELYQDVIPPQPQRFVDFTLPAQGHDLQALRWLVTFPLDASNIATTPPMTLLGQNHFGMEEYERQAGPLPARQKATQTIEWVRQSNEPSFDLTDNSASDSLVQEDLLPLYMGLSLLFLLGLGMVLHGAWQFRKKGAEQNTDL